VELRKMIVNYVPRDESLLYLIGSVLILLGYNFKETGD